MVENAAKLESVFREELEKIPKNLVVNVRGRGLMFAIDVHDSTYTTLISYGSIKFLGFRKWYTLAMEQILFPVKNG